MLNTKYIIQQDQQGKDQVYPNPDALGAAWFVKAVRFEQSSSAVMNALTTLNPKDTALVLSKDKSLITSTFAVDSTAAIRLIQNKNDVVTYQSSATSDAFAVFSEVFYEKGWRAYVDDKEVPVIRTNYVLRGLTIPAGQHNIRFEFKPASYYTGKQVANIINILIFVVLGIAIYIVYKSNRKTTPSNK